MASEPAHATEVALDAAEQKVWQLEERLAEAEAARDEALRQRDNWEASYEVQKRRAFNLESKLAEAAQRVEALQRDLDAAREARTVPPSAGSHRGNAMSRETWTWEDNSLRSPTGEYFDDDAKGFREYVADQLNALEDDLAAKDAALNEARTALYNVRRLGAAMDGRILDAALAVIDRVLGAEGAGVDEL